MTETAPVLDIAEALNRAMGDAEFLKMMMEELQRTIPPTLATLQSAIDANDMENLSREAHQFKGAAANLGAKALAAVALELEMIGKSGSPEGAADRFRQLQSASEVLNRRIEGIDWSAVPP